MVTAGSSHADIITSFTGLRSADGAVSPTLANATVAFDTTAAAGAPLFIPNGFDGVVTVDSITDGDGTFNVLQTASARLGGNLGNTNNRTFGLGTADDMNRTTLDANINRDFLQDTRLDTGSLSNIGTGNFDQRYQFASPISQTDKLFAFINRGAGGAELTNIPTSATLFDSAGGVIGIANLQQGSGPAITSVPDADNVTQLTLGRSRAVGSGDLTNRNILGLTFDLADFTNAGVALTATDFANIDGITFGGPGSTDFQLVGISEGLPVAAIPEPSALAMLGLFGAGLLVRRRR